MTGKMMEGKEWREEEGQYFQGRSKVRMHWDGWRRSKWGSEMLHTINKTDTCRDKEKTRRQF